MVWIVNPLKGLNDLKFDMSVEEVGQALNLIKPVTSTHSFEDGTKTEFRGIAVPVCGYRNEKLICIDTHWLIGSMMLDDRDLFAENPSECISQLQRKNEESAFISNNIIFFFNIGMSLCNFSQASGKLLPADRSENDERGIGVFAKGAFDEMRPHCAPISLPKR